MTSGGRPFERAVVLEVPGDVGVDLRGEVFLRGEGTSREELASKNGEPALDLVEPGRVLRREVARPPRVFIEPLVDVRRVVGGQVIHDDVSAAWRVDRVDDVEQLHRRRREKRRPARSRGVRKIFDRRFAIEASSPVLDRAHVHTQHARYVRARHAVGHHQQYLRPTNDPLLRLRRPHRSSDLRARLRGQDNRNRRTTAVRAARQLVEFDHAS